MRSLGLSNFTVEDYQDLEKALKIPPVYNQIEVNPFSSKGNDCILSRTGYQDCSVQTSAQGTVAERDTLGHGDKVFSFRCTDLHPLGHSDDFIVIPKSSNPKRMAENMKVFDFDIQPSDMDVLDKLTTKESVQAWHEHYLSRHQARPAIKSNVILCTNYICVHLFKKKRKEKKEKEKNIFPRATYCLEKWWRIVRRRVGACPFLCPFSPPGHLRLPSRDPPLSYLSQHTPPEQFYPSLT